MSTDPLKDLLIRADGAVAGAESAPQDLPGKLRRKLLRRRQVRRAAISCMVLGLCALPLLVHRRPAAPPQVADLAGLRREIESLEQKARVDSLTADCLLAMESRDRRASGQLPPDPMIELKLQQDQAARTLLYTADRYLHDLHEPREASAQYERVVKLFPTTSAASVARQRLEQL